MNNFHAVTAVLLNVSQGSRVGGERNKLPGDEV